MSRRKRERNRLSYDKAAVPGPGLSEGSESPAVAGGLTKRSAFVSYMRTHRIAIAIVALALFTTTAVALKYLDDDAKRKRAAGVLASKDSTSWLDTVIPFTTAPMPNPTPQLSKEYIYAGSRLLAVEDANANAAPPADLAIWRPSSGVWWVMGQEGSAPVTQGWGIPGDVPAQGDFDGDGKTDFSIYRPSTGTWWIVKSSDGTYYAQQFGIASDYLAQADYDGDGRTDVAVWRATDGVWYIISSSTGGVQYATYGTNGDKPAPADYDGDGRADIAVWRSSNYTFYSVNSSDAQSRGASFGSSGDTPVCADYDGDGKANYALRSGASWIVLNTALTQTTTTTPSGDQSSDIPVQNDYDGDGKVDIAVWRKTESYPQAGDVGTWYIRQSASGNSLRQVQWGIAGDIPVPAYYRR